VEKAKVAGTRCEVAALAFSGVLLGVALYWTWPTPGREVRSLLHQLESGSSYLRENARRELRRIGPTAIPALMKAFKDFDRNPVLSAGAEVALAEIGRPAVPYLMGALSDDREDVRCRAVATLGAIGPPAKPAIPSLIDMLEAGEPVRRGATVALARIEPSREWDLSELIAEVNAGEDYWSRRQAICDLGLIGPGAKAAVPALLKAVGDENDIVRAAAAEALGRIGAPAKDIVPMLRAALKDDSEYVRQSAAAALRRLHGEPPGSPVTRRRGTASPRAVELPALPPRLQGLPGSTIQVFLVASWTFVLLGALTAMVFRCHVGRRLGDSPEGRPTEGDDAGSSRSSGGVKNRSRLWYGVAWALSLAGATIMILFLALDLSSDGQP